LAKILNIFAFQRFFGLLCHVLSSIIYRVTNKEWGFRDDSVELILLINDSLQLITCISFGAQSLKMPKKSIFKAKDFIQP